MSILERLWRNTVPCPITGCYLWAGSEYTYNGYGRIRYMGRWWRVNRLAFKLLVGKLRRGKEVLHKCDTRPCWNPHHLKQGTTRANAKDRHKKGRTRGACAQADDQLPLPVVRRNARG